MADYKLTRGADWPPELHLAADNYEHAVRVTAAAPNEGQLTAALSLLDVTKSRLGVLLLKLDRQRRPHIYEKEPQGAVAPAPAPWRREGMDILGADNSRVCVLLEGDPVEHRENPAIKRKIDAEGRLIQWAPAMRNAIESEARWLRRMAEHLGKGLHATANECEGRAEFLEAMLAKLSEEAGS